jgi:hypothetical protein
VSMQLLRLTSAHGRKRRFARVFEVSELQHAHVKRKLRPRAWHRHRNGEPRRHAASFQRAHVRH